MAVTFNFHINISSMFFYYSKIEGCKARLQKGLNKPCSQRHAKDFDQPKVTQKIRQNISPAQVAGGVSTSPKTPDLWRLGPSHGPCKHRPRVLLGTTVEDLDLELFAHRLRTKCWVPQGRLDWIGGISRHSLLDRLPLNRGIKIKHIR